MRMRIPMKQRGGRRPEAREGSEQKPRAAMQVGKASRAPHQHTHEHTKPNAMVADARANAARRRLFRIARVTATVIGEFR